MKGDMYDDGTPNPLIVKCPICGGIDITAAIGTGQVEYHCNGCNHTWFLQKQEITSGGPLQYAQPSASVPSYSITTHYSGGSECVMDNYTAWLTGWMCHETWEGVCTRRKGGEMEYKGYTGSIEYSRHDGCFYGKIEDIADLVNYEGRTLEELENSFHEAVDDFIIFLQKTKK